MPSECSPRPYSDSASPSCPDSRNDILFPCRLQPTSCRPPGPAPQFPADTIPAPTQIQISGIAPVNAVPRQPSATANVFIRQPSPADLPDEYRQLFSSTPPYQVEHDSAHHYGLTLPRATHPHTDTHHMRNSQYPPSYRDYLRDPQAGQAAEPAIQFVQPSLTSRHPHVSSFLLSTNNRSKLLPAISKSLCTASAAQPRHV
jgi:hypothetical protein